MDINNPCEFIRKIYESPNNTIIGLTVRNLLMLRAHVQTCEECNRLTQEVVDDAPPDIPFHEN